MEAQVCAAAKLRRSVGTLARTECKVGDVTLAYLEGR